MPLQCTATPPASFTYTVTSCLTVNLTSTNCAGPWNWNFGDTSTGSGQTVSHTYAAPGTYTVTLTVPSASPTTQLQSITLGLQPVTIAGPSVWCDSTRSNYSAVGPVGYTYSWSITGGVPATATGNNVDVTWSGAGTITLVATDPTTGCTATMVKNVGTCPTCLAPPLNMTAWFPLDELSGTIATEYVLGANGIDIAAPPHGVGKVRRARSFNGLNQYVQANDAPGLNFGTGDITIDAWVKTLTATGIASIVDKRVVDPEQGYALYVKNGRLAFRLADQILPTGVEYWSATTPFIADGQWHHVAGVLRRSATTNGTRLYVDGILAATFPAFTGGSVTTTEKLLIGAEAGFSGPTSYTNGSIDEVELFQRSLTTGDLNGIYLADSLGKCKEFSYVPTVATICRDQSSVTLTLQVCNYTAATQSYNVTFSGLPPGGTCTFNGPTGFTLLTPNPIVVPANSCVPVQYKVARPAGMPLYSTSCYLVTVTNISSTVATQNVGSIYAARRLCNFIVIGPVGVGGPTGAARVMFRVTNTDDISVSTPYTIRVSTRAGSAENPLVALNGLPPGDVLHGNLALAPGQFTDLDVSASFTEPRAFRYYDIVLKRGRGRRRTAGVSVQRGGDVRDDRAVRVGAAHRASAEHAGAGRHAQPGACAGHAELRAAEAGQGGAGAVRCGRATGARVAAVPGRGGTGDTVARLPRPGARCVLRAHAREWRSRGAEVHAAGVAPKPGATRSAEPASARSVTPCAPAGTSPASSPGTCPARRWRRPRRPRRRYGTA